MTRASVARGRFTDKSQTFRAMAKKVRLQHAQRGSAFQSARNECKLEWFVRDQQKKKKRKGLRRSLDVAIAGSRLAQAHKRHRAIGPFKGGSPLFAPPAANSPAHHGIALQSERAIVPCRFSLGQSRPRQRRAARWLADPLSADHRINALSARASSPAAAWCSPKRDPDRATIPRIEPVGESWAR